MRLSSLTSLLGLSLTALRVQAWNDDPSDGVPPGFVTTKGSEFWLDHYPFYFNGANCYWLPQLVHDYQYDQVFQVLQSLGVKVVRTWAFSMLTAEQGLPSTNLTYYQYWANDTVFVNIGNNGLERLDTTVKYAEEYDIRLILTLTNNWNDYGGMDAYVNQTLGPSEYHSDFYTSPATIERYEAYAYNIVARYRNSSAVFAWELANEPRSNGYPSIARPNFTVSDLTKWFEDRSKYIKSIDPDHMVAIGDEGYYNNAYNKSDYIYNGESGLDFDRNLEIDTIDFGTFHLYPIAWSELPYGKWGLTWIQQHIDSMKKADKPVVMEEFGMTGYDNQTSIYPEWFHLAEKGGLGGIMLWSLGASSIDIKDTTVSDGGPDVMDNFDINPNKTAIWSLWQECGQVMNAKSGKGMA